MRPTRVAISTDMVWCAGRTVLTYLFPFDVVDNQVNPEDLVDVEHQLDTLECILADNSQAHVPSPSPPHGIFPSFHSLHKMHLSLSSFEHDTKFSVCVCVALQVVASVEARPVAVVRGAHAVTASTATCHPLHRCVLAARATNNVPAVTATSPPTALPIIPTTGMPVRRNWQTLNTAPPLATLLMKSPYQLCEASILSMHSSLSTLESSMQCLATTSDSTGAFAKHPVCLSLSVYRSRIVIFDIFRRKTFTKLLNFACGLCVADLYEYKFV